MYAGKVPRMEIHENENVCVLTISAHATIQYYLNSTYCVIFNKMKVRIPLILSCYTCRIQMILLLSDQHAFHNNSSMQCSLLLARPSVWLDKTIKMQ
jgi:hypothetical protein